MIITHPEPGVNPPLWRAQLQDSDRPTRELMRVQVEKYGLSLPDEYSGSNESIYLAAAAGATLKTTLNFLSNKDLTRIDVNNIGHEGMSRAALLGITGAGSYYESSMMLNDFEVCRDWFNAEDYAYLTLFYCQLTPVRRVRRWLAHVIEAERIAGNNGLLLPGNVEHAEDLIESFPFEPGYEVERVQSLHLLLTLFDEAELTHMLRDLPLSATDMRLLALLRRELGSDMDVDTLLSEMRSMKPSWLNTLLS